jgi:prevent-host-death family protein
MTTYVEIGAYEAKTHLADFLRKVQAGAAFRITQRGKPVADLVPAAAERRFSAEAAARLRRFMHERAAGQAVDVRALLEEGRD